MNAVCCCGPDGACWKCSTEVPTTLPASSNIGETHLAVGDRVYVLHDDDHGTVLGKSYDDKHVAVRWDGTGAITTPHYRGLIRIRAAENGSGK